MMIMTSACGSGDEGRSTTLFEIMPLLEMKVVVELA